jgi:1,2-diacylglycerol 3-beta-glucosyltransferase
MQSMISVVEITLVVIFGFLLLYLAVLSVLALTSRQRVIMKCTRFRKMAVVIPAHNEESGVKGTIHSLLSVDYPRELFRVIVVADNCTDGTADVARRSGAIVYERENQELRGKGHALQWCFSRLLQERAAYEAIIVVDADSVVSTNFLSVLNFYLENGAKVIQCSDLVEPTSASWSSEVIRIGFTLYNHARPLGRRMIGCSAGLRGNGMCFAVDTLRSVPWEAYSLTEDLEYGLELILRGITVTFAPEASVRSPMPQSAGNAESQRARWEAGRLPVVRRYAGRLLQSAFKRFSFRLFDAFVDLVTPPLVNLLIVIVMLFVLSALLSALGVAEADQFVLMWLGLIGLAFFHVIVGLWASGAAKSTYKALLHIPRYALWKVLLYAKLLKYGRTEVWVRTTRDHSVVQAAEGEIGPKVSK